MAVHYKGDIQPTPGEVACGEPAFRGLTPWWAGVTCNPCKIKLANMLLQPTDEGSPVLRVSHVQSHKIGLAQFDVATVPDSDAIWIAYHDLDGGTWRVIEP